MPLGIFYSQIIWQNDAKIGAISSEILTACLFDHLILSSFGKTARNIAHLRRHVDGLYLHH